jgi:hypothetical protein
MSRGLAVALLCAVVVSPVFGHGTLWNINFTIDSTQSSLTLAFQGSPKYTWGVSPLCGSYVLNTLDTDTSIAPSNWNMPLTAETISAQSTTTLVFGFGAQTGTIQPFAGTFTDLDRYDNDGPITMAGGPPISSGTLTTDLKIYILGTMPALMSSGNPHGTFLLNEWLEDLPWQVQVADDNYLGVTVASSIESKLSMYAVYPVVAGGVTTYLDVSMKLAGAGPLSFPPEPATGALLVLGGLALLNRRRAL